MKFFPFWIINDCTIAVPTSLSIDEFVFQVFFLPGPVLDCLFLYVSSHMHTPYPRFAVLESHFHNQGLVVIPGSYVYFSFSVKNCIFFFFIQ